MAGSDSQAGVGVTAEGTRLGGTRLRRTSPGAPWDS